MLPPCLLPFLRHKQKVGHRPTSKTKYLSYRASELLSDTGGVTCIARRTHRTHFSHALSLTEKPAPNKKPHQGAPIQSYAIQHSTAKAAADRIEPTTFSGCAEEKPSPIVGLPDYYTSLQ
jgi:hypothetical protein